MKAISTVAATTLILTGLTLPSFAASAEEPTGNPVAEVTPMPEAPIDAPQAPDATEGPEPAEAPVEEAAGAPAEESAGAPVEDAPEPPVADAGIADAPVIVAPAAVPGGTAVLTTSIEPVDHITTDPQTTAAWNTHDNRVGYRVSYSCAVSACDNVTVKLAPSQPSPYFTAAQIGTLLQYSSWTSPFIGATITGDDATGKVVNLGNLTPGSSGTFQVVYTIGYGGSYTTNRPANAYPSGFQIQNSATIDAATASATASANAAPVTWKSEVPNPSQSITNPGIVKPGQTVSYKVYMGSGAFVYSGSGAITGTSRYVGAGSWTVVDKLPAEASYVSSNGGGVYDPAAHTVTWTLGSESQPDPNAIGGWGSSATSGWTTRGGYTPRTVSVRYEADRFPAATNGCDFTADVTHEVSSSLTYLDADRTTKTTSGSMKHTVSCVSPFGDARIFKDSTSSASSGNTRLLNVPTTDTPNTFNWIVDTFNRGNVPGVAVVTDNTLDQADAPVFRINTSPTTPLPTINYSYVCSAPDPVTGQTSVTGSAVSRDLSLTAAQKAAGCRYATAEITSGEIGHSRVSQTDPNSGVLFRVAYYYDVSKTAPVGQTRMNTASGTMTYPGQPGIADVALEPVSRTIKFRETPDPTKPKPAFTSGFVGAAVVEGGGAAVPGRSVTFNVRGASGNIPVDTEITPEYVFLAPAGWTITADSASFPAGSVPDGVTFTYRTATTIGGVERQVVAAKWPDTVAFGMNTTWPTMTVVTSPTFQVAPGTNSQAHAWMGDVRETYDNVTANFGGATQNTADVVGDGATSQWFASSAQNVLVSSADGLSVLKEICLPDAEAPDGCKWISDSSRTVQVPVNSSSIKYRVSLQNTGNTALSNVVAYDVLPHLGDTGLIPATAGTPRGSSFNQTLNSVSDVSDNLTMSYSASTNPSRPEVSPAGTTNDWSGSESGKVAIRAAVNGALAPGQVAAFTYTSAVGAGAAADAKACNSVAIASNRTLPSEPQPVCATTAEADLEVGGVDTIDAQLGRPTVFPFVFENLGGSQSAPAEVSVKIPAGVTVTGFPTGWTCTPSSLPVTGPATLACTPPANLEKDTPVTFDLPAIVTADGVAVTASVTGTMYDPEEGNNEHTITVPNAVAAASGLTVAKTDGVTGVTVGQESTYTITVTNPLEFEALTGATITDTIPAGTEFVSASNGGTFAGGVVTWSLDVAAAASADVTVTVRVLDAAADSIVNTAAASVADPAFPTETLTGTGSDTDSVDRLTLTKTGAIANASAPKPGDVVTYTFVATNNGGGVLSGVEITDAMPGLSAITIGSWPALPGFLGAGQSVTGTATYTLTQADVDAGTVSNTATATGTSAGGGTVTVDATEDITLPSAPVVLVQKDGAIAAGTPKAGDLVTYTFTVKNAGNVTLTAVGIDDPMAGLSAITFGTWPGTAGQLAAGQSVTASATYALTQADIDAGKVDNTATGSGVPPTGAPVTSTDGATVTLVQNTAISLEKTGALPDPTNVAAGDTITYTFTAVNTGNVTLTGVTIADPLAGLSPLTYSWPDTTTGVLAPGQTVTATATFVTGQEHVDAGKVDNTATATGDGPSGNVSATDATTVSLLADAELSLVKTAAVAAGDPKAGDTVTYTFEVENTGNVTIDSVEIDDQLAGLSAIEYGAWPGADGVLKRGEKVTATATYELTQADVDAGTVDNTAVAAGEAPNGDAVSATDAVTVSLTAAPAITLVKDGSIAAGAPKAGDTVSYDFEVENTGNVTLSGVGITDQLAGISDVEFGAWPAADGVLAPGEKATATATYTLTQADLDAGTVVNVATVDAAGARGGDVTAEDGVTVDLPAAPALELVKDAKLDAGGTPKAGDTVTFSFEVTNTGNVTVAGVSVLDTMAGLSALSYDSWPAADGVLAPGESVTATASYVLTQDDLDGGTVFNDATVTGAPARGDLDDTGDSATVELPAAPALAFTKTGTAADPERPLADQLVTFEFEIENTGNVTVDGIAITDELDGLSDVAFGTWPGADGVLAPGEKVTATATYPLTQADIDASELLNEATVAGTPARGDALEVPAEVTVELPALPGLAIVKTAELADANGDGFANPGEKITYSFDVENTGNVTMHDVVVNDAKVTGIPDVGELAPGETVTVQAAEYTVTTAEGAAGEVVNTATATGEAPDGSTIDADESSTTTKAGLIPGAPVVKDGLAHTGFAGSDIAVLSGLMVLAGIALLGFVLLRRRRDEATTD
ncbi:hypothetical protein ASE14_12160 [Agromyces sp. Root81]|nr:hypothetical protein ASE14_12160 [Agromyces sp. Root81]